MTHDAERRATFPNLEGKVFLFIYTDGMIAAPSSPPVLSLDAIEALVYQAEPRALFVEPRILRRVIIQDRRIPGLGLRVPHSKVYTIERERLLIIADRSELGLSPAEELPRRMILLARPTDDEEFARRSSAERLHAFWRLTFHGRVHAEVEQQIDVQQLTSALITERIRRMGSGEFAEVRQVLLKDELLLPPQDDEVAYVEFLAVALELKYFAPWDQPLFFPAIRNWEALEPLWAELPHAEWYRQTQPAGAPERLVPAVVDVVPTEVVPVVATGSDLLAVPPVSLESPMSEMLLARAEKAGQVGNQVKSAILRMRVVKADSSNPDKNRAGAEADLRQLAQRLQRVWRLSDAEMEAWWRALCPLLNLAAEGYRSVEARILYDLQKVCVANERGVYRFNVWGWVKSLGGEPLRRELPLLETVQSAKYLRSTADRASSIRISASDRNRLMALIDEVQTRSDQELRQTVRPLIEKTFDDVGLVPQNIPERVARRKVIEGLLDRLVERGFITMGDVRDALSQSSLKLPDVSGPLELAWGDRLLRADRQLAKVLDGVYRQGAIYLRSSQRLSSLAFGTGLGRWLVRHVVLPFGGAYLALAVLIHLWEGFFPPHPVKPVPPAVAAVVQPADSVPPPEPGTLAPPASAGASSVTMAATLPQGVQSPTEASPAGDSLDDQPPLTPNSLEASPGPTAAPEGLAENPSSVELLGDRVGDVLKDAGEAAVGALKKGTSHTAKDAEAARAKSHSPSFYMAWFTLGIMLWMLLDRPQFRRSLVKFFTRLWVASRWLVYELPVSVIDSPLVHRVLESRGFAIFKGYVLRPLGVTLIIVGAFRLLLQHSLSWRNWLDSFLVLNLFLNSPAGRSVEERVLDICVRAWHELRFRIFAVIYHWVMDLFHDAMQWIEQSLYTVDEWLRFRAGDPGRFVLLKILIGSVWSVVSYVIRFVMTLLVEPQINPIKHFPVVTISHKILLPYTFHMRDLIHGSVGEARMAESTALAIASTIVILAPGVIGFLVWELKENWQLYVANRPTGIQPVRVGSHGESITALLRPGFRSGTLAKLYTKLRSALRLESDPGHGHRSTRQLAHIDSVVLAVRRFVEREFCVLIAETRLLEGATISVGRLEPATNRFDLELWSSLAPERPLILRWEDLNGWLAARVVDPGWMTELPEGTRSRLNVALTGLYKLAGVDLVREQVLSAVGSTRDPEPGLELEHEAVRLISSHHAPVVYPLRVEGRTITPVKTDGTPATDRPVVERGQLLFCETDVIWSEWVQQWPVADQAPPPPVKVPELIRADG